MNTTEIFYVCKGTINSIPINAKHTLSSDAIFN